MNVYTMTDWKRDCGFKAKAGQEITEEIYNEMLNTMPPLKIPQAGREIAEKCGIIPAAGFLMGEPYEFGAAGTLYRMFVKDPAGKFYYAGLCPHNLGDTWFEPPEPPQPSWIEQNNRITERFINVLNDVSATVKHNMNNSYRATYLAAASAGIKALQECIYTKPEIRNGKHFCGNCGMDLVHDPEHIFCPGCGRPVWFKELDDYGSPEEWRKHISKD